MQEQLALDVPRAPQRCPSDSTGGGVGESQFEEWSRKYLAALSETSKCGGKPPADISERIRFNVRAELDSEMQEFRAATLPGRTPPYARNARRLAM
jgi:hypothetical protein